MEEIWKSVSGYEGLYEVSSHGRINSLPREIAGNLGGSYLTKSRILNPPIYSDDYRIVKLFRGGKLKRKGVHVLVALEFIPNPGNKPMVNHKDGNKLNNAISNLEWVTDQENHQHAAQTGLKAKGDGHGFSKLNSRSASIIKGMLVDGIPQRQIAKTFGVCQATVKDINRNQTWRDAKAEPEYKHLLG